MNEDERLIVESNLRQLERGIVKRELELYSQKQEVAMLKKYPAKLFAKIEPTYLYESEEDWLEYAKDITVSHKEMIIDDLKTIVEADKAGLERERIKLSLADEGIDTNGGATKE